MKLQAVSLNWNSLARLPVFILAPSQPIPRAILPIVLVLVIVIDPIFSDLFDYDYDDDDDDEDDLTRDIHEQAHFIIDCHLHVA